MKWAVAHPVLGEGEAAHGGPSCDHVTCMRMDFSLRSHGSMLHRTTCLGCLACGWQLGSSCTLHAPGTVGEVCQGHSSRCNRQYGTTCNQRWCTAVRLFTTTPRSRPSTKTIRPQLSSLKQTRHATHTHTPVMPPDTASSLTTHACPTHLSFWLSTLSHFS